VGQLGAISRCVPSKNCVALLFATAKCDNREFTNVPLVSRSPGRLLSHLADATGCVRAVVMVHHFNVTPVTRLHLRPPFLVHAAAKSPHSLPHSRNWRREMCSPIFLIKPYSKIFFVAFSLSGELEEYYVSDVSNKLSNKFCKFLAVFLRDYRQTILCARLTTLLRKDNKVISK